MSGPPISYDWQISCTTVKYRGEYLLESGIWSDCRFIVGTEPNQQVLEGHKLFLAMASPVFEAMFYGGMAEKDPISILDVQPEAFRALLEYIYTDKINLTSFDQACELCYGARKYMLPHLVEKCTKNLQVNVYPRNACRGYEFAKLFDEPGLMQKCLNTIRNRTQEVLSESSFDDVSLSTILMIFDQDPLNINSEMELFNALTRYANRHNQTAGAKVPKIDGIANPTSSEVTGGGRCRISTSTSSRSRYQPTIRDALMKIRFLTLSRRRFIEGPATSNLLTEADKSAILANISLPNTDVSMPTGFSISTVFRQRDHQFSLYVMMPYKTLDTFRIAFDESTAHGRRGIDSVDSSSSGEDVWPETSKKLYCTRTLRHLSNCMNTSVLDDALTFSCDKNVCVYGVQVPTQVLMIVDDREEEPGSNSSYNEILYAHLLDEDDNRLTYTHYTRGVKYRSVIDILFNTYVHIEKNKQYKVELVLNRMGWYPIGSYPTCSTCNGVVFTFVQGRRHCQIGIDSVEGLIRSIIFSIPPPMNPMINNPDPKMIKPPPLLISAPL